MASLNVPPYTGAGAGVGASKAVIHTESSNRAAVVSPKGAVGLSYFSILLIAGAAAKHKHYYCHT